MSLRTEEAALLFCGKRVYWQKYTAMVVDKVVSAKSTTTTTIKSSSAHTSQ